MPVDVESLERRRVQLAFARPPEAVFVPGSEQALSDVMQNLIVNAVEAVPAGGSVRLRLTRNVEATVEVEVFSEGVEEEEAVVEESAAQASVEESEKDEEEASEVAEETESA